MTEPTDITKVITILLQHYFNVGSDGYPASVYQDEYLQGLQDGVDTFDQALQLYQTNRQQFIEQYVQHRFQSDHKMSTKPISMYTMLGTYRPNVGAPMVNSFLVVHVPTLKFSHCYALMGPIDINQLDDQPGQNPDAKSVDGLQYHMAVAESFHDVFDSDANGDFDFSDIESTEFLAKRGNEYANEYQFDTAHIKTGKTSEATLDLDVDNLMEKLRPDDLPRI